MLSRAKNHGSVDFKRREGEFVELTDESQLVGEPVSLQAPEVRVGEQQKTAWEGSLRSTNYLDNHTQLFVDSATHNTEYGEFQTSKDPIN